MCGRYRIDGADGEMAEMMDSLNRKGVPVTEGDVHPMDVAPVYTRDGAQAMRWGYSLREGRPVINARRETVSQKPMFAGSMSDFRLIVPAAGFYEWKGVPGQKTRYWITRADGGRMYMAGLYRMEAGEARFVVVTREAEGEMRDVHSRMPLVIDRSAARAWLEDAYAAQHMLVQPQWPGLTVLPDEAQQITMWE